MAANITPSAESQRLIAEITALMQAERAPQALALCEQLQVLASDQAPLLSWLSHAHQRMGNYEPMVALAGQAAALMGDDFKGQRRLVECLVYSGQIDQARARLAALEADAPDDPNLLHQVAELHVHCEGHADAYRCCARAATLRGNHPGSLYALAAASLAIGRIGEAEALFDRVIALDPADGDAYVNRSSLKTWTSGTHHIDAMTAVLRRLSADHPARSALHYALAKELEDLSQPEASFAHLRLGADLRRARLSYRVDGDVQTLADIRSAFQDAHLARPANAGAAPTNGPLFVLGLPRSGTTLVERILASHSQVASLGEVNTLAFSIMRLASTLGDKHSLVRRSAALDGPRLAAIYRAGARSYGADAPRLVDKMPSNFLYLGVIHKALPEARVVHLRRHPLDSCYAMYKTLFRMGYPYSYSLDDLGHYYLAYHRLMAHWRTLIPGSFLDLDYEQLVNDQPAQTERLLMYCGLRWEDACLNFHENAAPSATASAAQVRRPLYRSSVARWRDHAESLAPLGDFLSRHGIDCS